MMHVHDRDPVAETRSRQLRPAPAPQRDPLAADARIDSTQRAGDHAALLSRMVVTQPARAAQTVRRLQRRHGNRYVKQVVDLSRRAYGSTEAADQAREQPRIEVKSFSYVPPAADRGAAHGALRAPRPDKCISETGESQDQHASTTTFTAHANGVQIVVEAKGVYTSTEFPEGFKWTQTIDTNAPLGGATSPYVDPRPNDDTKPFYYTDAEHAASPTTFRDRPSRPTPAVGTTDWDAVLCLNGVNEASKVAIGYDYLTYGFSIDTAGKVTTRPARGTGGGVHRSTLAAEFPNWTFDWSFGWSILNRILHGVGIYP